MTFSADDTIIAMFCQPSLQISMSNTEEVSSIGYGTDGSPRTSRSTVELHVKTANRIQRAPASTLFRGAKNSGSIQLHIRLPSTWSTRIIQVGKKAGQRPRVLDPLLKRSGLSIRHSVLVYEQLIHHNGLCVPELVVRFCSHPRVFILRITQLGTLVRSKFTTIRRYQFWRTSENENRVYNLSW